MSDIDNTTDEPVTEPELLGDTLRGSNKTLRGKKVLVADHVLEVAEVDHLLDLGAKVVFLVPDEDEVAAIDGAYGDKVTAIAGDLNNGDVWLWFQAEQGPFDFVVHRGAREDLVELIDGAAVHQLD